MWIWRRSCWQRSCAEAIFSARRCGPRPAMSASAWPSHASLIRGAPGCRRRRSREVSHSSATRQRTLPLARFAASALMQPEYAVDGAKFGGLDQLGMGHRHGEQRSLQRFFPEAEKILQRRKFREQIVILPDVSLQQRGMIRHAIQNLRRRQPITQHLFPEILGNTNSRDHAKPPLLERIHEVAADREPPGGDALT